MKYITLIVLVSAIGITGYLALPIWPDPGVGAAQTPDSEPPYRMSQTYSSKCNTGSVICIVPAQPVGSPCFCAEKRGTIIP
jgi:hypothetical protein